MIRLPRLMSSIALASAAFAVTVVIPNPSFAARQAADEKMADDKAAPAATENQGAPTLYRCSFHRFHRDGCPSGKAWRCRGSASRSRSGRRGQVAGRRRAGSRHRRTRRRRGEARRRRRP